MWHIGYTELLPVLITISLVSIGIITLIALAIDLHRS